MTDLTVTAVMTRDPVAVAPFVGLDQRQQRGTRHAARSQLRWSTQGPHRVAEPARKGAAPDSSSSTPPPGHDRDPTMPQRPLYHSKSVSHVNFGDPGVMTLRH